MKKSHFRFLRNKWVIAAIAVVVLIIVISIYKRSSAKPSFETAQAAITDVVETVSVTGSISAAEKSDLSFKKGGVISAIYVKVGDGVSRGQAIASLDGSSDRAALQSAQATLDDMTRSLTKEEQAVQDSSLSGAKSDALNAAHDALVKVQSAVFNYADTFYSGAQGANPAISIRTDSQAMQVSMNAERLSLSAVLDSWDQDLHSSLPLSQLMPRVQGYLSSAKSFMNDLMGVVSELNPTNSGQQQSSLNAYLATMNTALSTVSSAADSVTTAAAALSSAQSNYDLKLAGYSSQAIEAQRAKVAQAQAEVSADTIFSPFDGIVTKADPHVGEYITPGQSGFAVQDSSFKIEANVPEADIAKVSVGNLASTTLDAYGAFVDFPAQVTQIDPAETVIEGVPTYKVTLHFLSADPRVRSGMTANLEILTHEKQGVLAIPFRALSTGNGSTTVRLLSQDGKSWTVVPVTTGLKGSFGNIEITGGLQEGDTVVTYVK